MFGKRNERKMNQLESDRETSECLFNHSFHFFKDTIHTLSVVIRLRLLFSPCGIY